MPSSRSRSVFRYGYADARKLAEKPDYQRFRKVLEGKGLKGYLVDLDKLPKYQEPSPNTRSDDQVLVSDGQ